jgi:methionyl-tRNA formyltransferase
MSLAAVPTHPRRLVYLGTPALAVPPLHALVDAGFEVVLVVTRVDKRRGRGSELSPSPVKAAALKLGIPVSHNVDDIVTVGAELGVVVAFGQLIRPHILAELPLVNLHYSLLPRWRGAAPIERALLAGDTETGVGLMQLEVGLDTGGLFAEVRTPISADETGETLRTRLTTIGCDVLVRSLQAGLGTPVPQEGEPLYASKLTPEDLRINWKQSAEGINRQVRLGGAWTLGGGQRLKVIAATVLADDGGFEAPQPGLLLGSEVETGSGRLRLETVQPEGKSPMVVREWLRGASRKLQDQVLGK